MDPVLNDATFCLPELHKLCRDLQGKWRNETEPVPKVWGPDSSARESPWTCQEGSEVTQQDPTTATQRSTWLLNSSLQKALLWARIRWKITARRSSWTKRPLGSRPCSRQRDSASPRAACCSPLALEAAGPSELLPPASLSPWHCSKHLWCLKPHVGAYSHSCPTFSAEGQAESQLHSGNVKTKCKCTFFSPSTGIFLNCVTKCEPCTVYFQLPSFRLLLTGLKHLHFYPKAFTKVVIIPFNKTKNKY